MFLHYSRHCQFTAGNILDRRSLVHALTLVSRLVGEEGTQAQGLQLRSWKPQQLQAVAILVLPAVYAKHQSTNPELFESGEATVLAVAQALVAERIASCVTHCLPIHSTVSLVQSP